MTPDEAAAAWIVRVEDGPLSAADQCAFDEWKVESPANVAAYERAEAAWNLYENPPSDPVMDAMRASALAIRPKPRRGLWAGVGVGLAASLLAAVALGTGLLSFGPQADAPQLAAQSAPTAAAPKAPDAGEFATAKGERRTVRLADGTSVTLNTDSAIRVGYVAERRLVRLLRGQALFEVAKDPHRPFVVQAGTNQVTALGTVFEVRLDANRMQVTLVEGKVVVDEPDDQSADSSAVMVPTVLTPGQTLVAAEGIKPVLAKVDVAQALRWRDGFVEFSDTSLADAVAEMNRYSGKQIVVQGPAAGNLRVSGVFRTGNPERFAAIVGELLPVRQRDLSDGRVELSAEGR
ncbi:FecR family protein [Sphingopyxis sp.]|uniref:FecR family protein n=1 Tax=Sphingopyxis sp. TaxID=1908224 RepID=UPI0026252E6E|nr:FecR family protein [Sphingopyxis sp.]MCW0199902.1 FecR family protein [Sphingopyxis sp.]